jgi:hypothetical protein
MSEMDQRRAALEQIFLDTSTLVTPAMTEADVRAKLIDPIFKDGLGWPEACIKREIHDDNDEYWDYLFVDAHPYFIVEAKRASETFQFPAGTIGRAYAIEGLFRADKKFKKAATQAARYCQDAAQLIPYAVVTNGRQLAIFKALRSDRGWLQGSALIFDSPKEIVDRFNEVWELLSYPAVKAGSLATFFSHPDETPRQYTSVIGTLPNADEILIRNRLNGTLIPVMRTVFDELTDERSSEVLERCYVYSRSLQTVADNFILTVQDLPPAYLKDQIAQIRPTKIDAGAFESSVRNIAKQKKRSTVMLLLGGVGAGKTTFLKKMRVKYCSNVIDSSGAYYYIDFRDAPPKPPFEGFVYNSLRKQLTNDERFVEICRQEVPSLPAGASPLHSPAMLKWLFQTDLNDIEALAREVGVTDPAEIGRRKLQRLEEASRDDREIVRRAFLLLHACNRFILLALDNADQLGQDYQLQIFLFAEHLASEIEVNVITALREEKYYLASQQGAFNAFQNQIFHISSPRLSDLLSLRLAYARDHLKELLPDSSPQQRQDANYFLEAIRTGGVGAFGRPGSSNVVRLLERLTMGNMRSALSMFRTFISSGNTKIDKILDIYSGNKSRRVPYHVPFHEFTKSVMLGDHRYYSEAHSSVVNVFALSGYGPGSHFTALRILTYLMLASNRTSVNFERGFVEQGELLDAFAVLPSGTQEARAQLQRLLKANLIEGDTGVASDLDRCRALRATAAGEYYLTFLVRAFAYLDLVFIDTPICDSAVMTRLRELRDGRDAAARFERVDLFLDYLAKEEIREHETQPALESVAAFQGLLIPIIADQIAKEKQVIAAKFQRYHRD